MIPFTQYLLPTGRKRAIEIERSAETEAAAKRFIAAGGWFEVEMLSDMKTVSLTAGHLIEDEPQDVACELCENGPEIANAVDRLVATVARMESIHA